LEIEHGERKKVNRLNGNIAKKEKKKKEWQYLSR